MYIVGVLPRRSPCTQHLVNTLCVRLVPLSQCSLPLVSLVSPGPHVSILFPSTIPVSTRRTPARDEPARSSAAALPSTEPARGFAAPLPALSPGSQSSPVTPLGGYDETGGCRPQNDTGPFIETSFPTLCDGQMQYDGDGRRADEWPRAGRAHNESDKAREAYSDGLC